MDVAELDSVADVTCVDTCVTTLADGAAVTLAFTGSAGRLNIWDVRRRERVASHAVLHGDRIHGIRTMAWADAFIWSTPLDGHTHAAKPPTSLTSAPSQTAPADDRLLLIFGARCVKLFRLAIHQPGSQAAAARATAVEVTLALCSDLGQRQQWVLDALVVPRSTEAQPAFERQNSQPPISSPHCEAAAHSPPRPIAGSAAVDGHSSHALAVLGLTDNSLEVWRLALTPQGASPGLNARIARVDCSVRLLLYAMTLSASWARAPRDPRRADAAASAEAPHTTRTCPAPDTAAPRAAGSCELVIRVAAGTIFHDILLWRVGVDVLAAAAEQEPSRRAALGGGQPPQVVPAVKLQGHVGSLMRVRFAAGGALLLSTADDRTARVWRVPREFSGDDSLCAEDGGGARCTLAQGPLLDVWGHAARVWDVWLLGRVLVTASEDQTCRLWHAHTGRQLASIPAHQGRGVWCCAPLNGRAVVSGGADAAVKLWALPDWLQASDLPALEQAVDLECIGQPSRDGVRAPDDVARPQLAPTKGSSADMVKVASVPPLTWLDRPRVDDGTSHADGDASEGGESESDAKDYVRAVALVSAYTVYVATRRGHIQRADLQLAAPSSRQAAAVSEPPPDGCQSGTQDSVPEASSRPAAAIIWSSVIQGGGVSFTSCFEAARLRDASADASALPATLESDPPTSATSASLASDGCNVDVLAIGFVDGTLVVLRCEATAGGVTAAHPLQEMRWQPDADKPVIRAFLPRSLSAGHVLTTSTDNRLQWWRLPGLAPAHDSAGDGGVATRAGAAARPLLFATAVSPRPHCIASMDVLPQRGLLVVGDLHGGVVAFAFPPAAAQSASAGKTLGVLPALFQLAACHGRSPVTMVQALGDNVTTGGRNGTINHFRAVPRRPRDGNEQPLGLAASQEVFADEEAASAPGWTLECSGRDKLAAISTVVDVTVAADAGGAADTLVAGFLASQFLIYSLPNNAELLSLDCGGWRRPHARHITSAQSFTIAFVRSGRLVVCHRFPPGGAAARSDADGGCGESAGSVTICPAHHGREVHDCVVLPDGAGVGAFEVVSGAEDGELRSLVFPEGCVDGGDRSTNSLRAPSCTRRRIGQHVAGTAIRCVAAACLAPFRLKHGAGDGANGCESGHQSGGRDYVIFSAGAREVQMAWMSRCGTRVEGTAASTSGPASAQTGGPAPPSPASERSAPQPDPVTLQQDSPHALPGPIHGEEWRGDQSTPSVGAAHGDGSGGRGAREHLWLATTAPRKGGLRPKHNAGFNSADGERRVLALEAFVAPDPQSAGRGASHEGHRRSVVFVASASSDASLKLAAFEVAGRVWHHVAELRHHVRPVLSLSHAIVRNVVHEDIAPSSQHPETCQDGDAQSAAADALTASRSGDRANDEAVETIREGGAHRPRVLLFSGSTDGCVAVWDVSEAIESWLHRHADSEAASCCPTTLSPVLVLTGHHMSGVNAMAAAATPGACVLLTGGDDQALKAAQLRFRVRGSALVASCCAVVHRPCAHASALKGLWTGGGVAFTVGLDQYLRVWRIQQGIAAVRQQSTRCLVDGGESGGVGSGVPEAAGHSALNLRLVGQFAVDVSEPSCVHAAQRSGRQDQGTCFNVAVGGRGIQVLQVDTLIE